MPEDLALVELLRVSEPSELRIVTAHFFCMSTSTFDFLKCHIHLMNKEILDFFNTM